MDRTLKQKISGKWISRFILQIFIYMAVTILLFVCAYFICANRIWMGTERFYPLIHLVHDNTAVCISMVLLTGCLVISWWNFRRIACVMAEVAEAVSNIYRDREAYVQLPPELKEMENQLNQIRIEAQADRQQAHETNQRKDDMLMYMAHDLKTPLTSVIGYLTLLNEEPDIPESARQRYLGVARKKAERLEELINGFFEITRFNFTHMILEKSYVNMGMMVNQILYEFQPIFAEKNLHFLYEAPEDVFVYCDVEKMERVYDNLFKNVANYSYADTDIRILLSGRKKTEEWDAADSEDETSCRGMRLVVENHGRTIPREKLEHLFEQFFRLDSSRDSQTGGSGLGLAVVKEIIQLHGGSVECESENEIIRFIVELP